MVGAGHGARVTPSSGQGARRPPSTPGRGAARRRARGPGRGSIRENACHRTARLWHDVKPRCPLGRKEKEAAGTDAVSSTGSSAADAFRTSRRGHARFREPGIPARLSGEKCLERGLGPEGLSPESGWLRRPRRLEDTDSIWKNLAHLPPRPCGSCSLLCHRCNNGAHLRGVRGGACGGERAHDSAEPAGVTSGRAGAGRTPLARIHWRGKIFCSLLTITFSQQEKLGRAFVRGHVADLLAHLTSVCTPKQLDQTANWGAHGTRNGVPVPYQALSQATTHLALLR
uniref:uncharacterized protein LOC118528662 n=1 Tax=Halichoerus grypus TaxID=9711 RepID=UPI0016593DC6|nr:uncharacterized protein LOC118528662 [Halichoerus grypus]